MTDALSPGATIGILGGGQLGRMLALAAARLGLKCHIFDPARDAPAAQVAAAHTAAAYDDIDALTEFAQGCAVVTYEFENIPTAALDAIEGACPIHPGRKALATSQDRWVEKEFLSGLGLAVAPYADITSADAIRTAMTDMGTAGILKTRRFGYDGKGQVRLSLQDEADEAFAQLNGAPAILEGLVPLMSEISVIAARSTDGAVAAFDPGENMHKDGILDTTTVPANVPNRLKSDAVLTAGRILNALDYVGVIGVEFFVTPSGLIVNEIAPRVHNSGHWTQNGCAIDQFEQHIRAIAGWPLGDGSRHSNVRMENLIGDDINRIPELAGQGAALHLYGKAEARPGRKMAHVNVITGPVS